MLSQEVYLSGYLTKIRLQTKSVHLCKHISESPQF
jgi:hypothetical protein